MAMTCSQIRDAFSRGEVPARAAVQAHLATCPSCSELFEHDAELGRALAVQAAPGADFPEELFARIDADVARESGIRAWLRSRPSQLRFQLLALLTILLIVIGGALRHRADLPAYPVARMVVLLGGYFVAILMAVGKELSLGPRRAPFADHLGLLIGAVGLPFLAALMPATEASTHAGPQGALGCFLYGALFTLPIGLLLWAFDRDDRPSLRTVCLSAAALGLSANLLLELHCPSGNPLHLVLGHASLGVAWLAAWLVTRRTSRA